MADPDARPTVLIVDDERGPRESLRMILEPAHRVLACAGGAEAIAILRSREVDVVTLDLQMPGMRGDELMRLVRREFPGVEIIVITGCGSVETAAEAVRQGICDYLQKPFDVVQVTAAVTRALARRTPRGSLTRFLEVEARGSRAAGSDRRARTRSFEFLEVLAETIETKDRCMRGHARRVACYAGLLAERIGLDARPSEELRIAAFLHDLGKVGVPTDLLLRAGALAASERRIVEEHPAIGARLLAPLDLPGEIALAVRHHHEWWDGNGYPDGIAGNAIPLAARVISVVDAFDAMTCDRPYRRALDRGVAAAELRRFAGSQFDPELATEFLVCLESGLCDLDPALLSDAVGSAAAPLVSAAP